VSAEINEELRKAAESSGAGEGIGSGGPERLIEYVESMEELKARAARLASNEPMNEYNVR
jgi:hypothetical protein